MFFTFPNTLKKVEKYDAQWNTFDQVFGNMVKHYHEYFIYLFNLKLRRKQRNKIVKLYLN